VIRSEIDSIRVPHLLARLALSERQFERRFVRAIGVTPHAYIRISRFRAAMRMVRSRRCRNLADVADALGYVDQSHFIKDAKTYSGYSPKQLTEVLRLGTELPCAVVVPDGAAPRAHPPEITGLPK
jgi:transcriptional regulator GlxA family with amidase domain